MCAIGKHKIRIGRADRDVPRPAGSVVLVALQNFPALRPPVTKGTGAEGGVFEFRFGQITTERDYVEANAISNILLVSIETFQVWMGVLVYSRHCCGQCNPTA